MKVSDIKTEHEFYQFMIIQYKRANQLIAIWRNQDEDEEKRSKAYKLWEIQDARVEELKVIESESEWEKQ